jgi:hypothetical protein
MDLKLGTKAAAALAGATAIATASPLTAYAHTPAAHEAAGTATYAPQTLDHLGSVNREVYEAFVDAKLDVLESAVAKLAAKVDGVPAGTVLTGYERLAAKRRLQQAVGLSALLAKVPTDGPYALTSDELARVAELRASLDETANDLRTLLANEPVMATPVDVKPIARTVNVAKARVLGTRFDREAARRTWTRWSWWDGSRDGWGDHDCDRDGSRDGSWDGSREGSRDWR